MNDGYLGIDYAKSVWQEIYARTPARKATLGERLYYWIGKKITAIKLAARRNGL
jgi:hypothetical protein